jgi:hypothetical protein
MKVKKAVIKNKKWISKKMTLADIVRAFEHVEDEPIIELLIDEGLIEKDGRYYEPTEKLLDEIYLPTTWKPTDPQRRFLMGNSTFSRKMLLMIMNEREIAKLLILGYFTVNANSKYKKSDKLVDFLMEGEKEVWFK